ncbi:hypothetical protein HNP46_005772 [Pseudomonas nitritireducens]|uniref:Uncharacterized protein n=1 Tax=Pseudomonas nitroreducens TaxID=46680 RepID=A0A7W7KQU7_PSENT|nr:hypothetical protein [Pseudomonas nitritireducens]MBB4866865.1 hypothetical protein [Pseudomonas nitritireducens]
MAESISLIDSECSLQKKIAAAFELLRACAVLDPGTEDEKSELLDDIKAAEYSIEDVKDRLFERFVGASRKAVYHRLSDLVPGLYEMPESEWPAALKLPADKIEAWSDTLTPLEKYYFEHHRGHMIFHAVTLHAEFGPEPLEEAC